MTLKEAEQILNRFTSDLAYSVGFSPIGNLRYSRREQDATAILSFPLRLSAQGSGLFTAGVGLRFELIEKWLSDDPTEMGTTLGKPIHFLREDKIYTEWEFLNTSDLDKLRDIILRDLRKYALPFIERYARLDDLRKSLESPNKEDWFNSGLGLDSRVTTLAAIKFAEGDKSGAIKILDDGIKALEETLTGRTHELRKRRFAMDYLRERILKEDK